MREVANLTITDGGEFYGPPMVWNNGPLAAFVGSPERIADRTAFILTPGTVTDLHEGQHAVVLSSRIEAVGRMAGFTSDREREEVG